jgi:hypothetical protein
LRRVAEDPDFWSRDEKQGRARHDAYLRAMSEIGHHNGTRKEPRNVR